MAFRKLVVFWFIVAVACDMREFLRPKTIRVYKFNGVCPGYENAPISFQDIHVSMSNRINTIKLKIVIKKDITEGLKLKLSLKRCQSREALDSCETYQTIRVNHLCDLIQGDNKPWSPFVKQTDPPLNGCPIKKNVHIVKNGTFDGSTVAVLPFAGWYWIVTAQVLGETTNKVIMCVVLEGQIVPLS